MYGYCVELVDDFELLLCECFLLLGVYVIDVLIDYLDNECVLNCEIKCLLV